MADMAHPSSYMKRRAAGWHTSTIRLETVDRNVDVDPTTGVQGETVTYTWEGPALVQQISVTRASQTAQDYGVGDLQVGVDDSAIVERGQRVTVLTSSDATLVGKVGHVETVDRHDLAARRRCVVRLESTT